MDLDRSRANTTCLARGCVQSPGDPVVPAGSGVLPIGDCECAEWEASLDGCKLLPAPLVCQPAEIVWCCEFRKQEE